MTSRSLLLFDNKDIFVGLFHVILLAGKLLQAVRVAEKLVVLFPGHLRLLAIVITVVFQVPVRFTDTAHIEPVAAVEEGHPYQEYQQDAAIDPKRQFIRCFLIAHKANIGRKSW